MKHFILIFSIALLSVSCGGGKNIKQKTTVPLGIINTPGVEIKSIDTDKNYFSLKSGERWTPPYQNDTKGFGLHNGNSDMVNFYRKAIDDMDAQKVRVKVPYQKEELYGVLLLSKIFDGCASATTRSYQITIPESYVTSALNGKVSVLYEYYSGCGELTGVGGFRGKTWVLWLSDIPFN